MTDGGHRAGGFAGRHAERLLAAAVVLTAALAALPVGTSWDLYAARFSGMMLACAAWSGLGILGVLRAPSRGDRWVMASLVALAAAVIVSSAQAYAPGQSLTYGAGYYTGAATWVGAFAVTALASLSRPGKGMRDGLLLAQAVPGAVGLVAVLMALAGRPVTASFENSNHLVPGLLIAAPVSLALAASSRATGLARWGSRGAGIFALLGAAMSGSTAGAVAAAGAVGLLAVFLPQTLRIPEGWRRGVRTTTVALFGVALAVLLAAMLPGQLPTPLGSAAESVLEDPSHRDRTVLWAIALRAAAEKPVFGVGADAYEVAGQRLMTGAPDTLLQFATETGPVTPDPHSAPFLVIASFGIVGATALISVVAAWVFEVRRLSVTESGYALRVAFGIGAASWAASLCLLPASVQWGAFPAMMLGLALTRAESSPIRRGHRVLLVALSAFVGILALLLSFTALAGAYWYSRALNADRPAAASAALARASAAQPTMGFYRFLVLDAAGDELGADDTALKRYQAQVDNAGPAVTEDVRYMAMLVRNSLDQAWASGRTDLEWEKQKLAQLESVAPALPEVRLERAHLALVAGDVATAKTQLEQLTQHSWVTGLRRFGLYRYYYAHLTGRQELLPQLRQDAIVDAETERLVEILPRR